MTTIGIFGTSGLAHEVGDVADALGLTPVFIARDAAARDAWAGADDVIVEDDAVRLSGAAFVIGIGAPAVRAAIARRHGATLRFATLIHPAASFGRGQRAAVAARAGVVVFAGARLSNTIDVGDFCLINPNATIGHDVTIGRYVTICPGATISGNVRIGNEAWIGAGAVINQGTPERPLSIGTSAVIGSGAVVVHDCDAGGVYAGVPARKRL